MRIEKVLLGLKGNRTESDIHAQIFNGLAGFFPLKMTGGEKSDNQ